MITVLLVDDQEIVRHGAFDEDEFLWDAIQAGASGFVLKDTPARG